MNDKILFNKNGYIVGITERGEYFESYQTLYSKNILGGAGLYIQELKAEINKLKSQINSNS